MLNETFIRRDAVFGGVCGGLAHKLSLPVTVLRILLLLSAFCTFGLTVLIYLAVVFSFPSELTAEIPDAPKFLGVCHKLAPKVGVSAAWLRFFTLVAWILTAFVPVFTAYLIIFLVQTATDDVASGPRSDSDVRDVN